MLFSHSHFKQELETVDSQQSQFESENCDNLVVHTIHGKNKLSPNPQLRRKNSLHPFKSSNNNNNDPKTVSIVGNHSNNNSNNNSSSSSVSNSFLVHNINTTTRTSSGSCIGVATDFSIAAIMARGGNASSREPSERSLSPLSLERFPDGEDDGDVDVVDCSDNESAATAARLARHNVPPHMQKSAYKHRVNYSNDSGNGSSNHNNSSNSSRGRASPQSPGRSEEDRLSPEPAKSSPKIVGSCNCDELLPIQCHLETKELWDKFHELGTEMIITKTGRRMFPTVRVSFSGPLRHMQPPDRYAVLIDIVPMDSRRYRYAYHRSSWLVAGKADPPPPARLYAHPDSPISVDALRKQVVSFEKVKLTNNEMDKSGQIVLNSMHRYQPRIHLVRLSHGQSIPNNPKDLQEMDHKTFVFPETVFTAVTAYQNQLITKLKIDSNPFAKGFRDSSRLTDFDRDPMDSYLFEQHFRSPLRFFPDPLMQQMSPQEADAASLAFLEKARQHLQMFGRSPYTEMILPHLYQRPPTAAALNAFNLGMWQQQWPQLTAGFLANQQAAAAQAAANAAAVAAAASRRTPPPLNPPPPATTPSSSGSASPDLRTKNFHRFSPYTVPQQQQQQQQLHSSSSSQPPPPSRSPPN
ncbi:T-box protein H15 isoform X2 [Stomoxys calcitrans]|uniref:T-box protein H15 isoform X2 n=1 Tax=Stomoxys calcitrans TaxID=35570 RepID=UPI0027E27094|nr:T-box protein H15 isoform X2 [Stomoxys calcitrans]